ncbi:Phenoxybenzoate dioxygenase subunit alpha [Streptomyces xanthophaeus]|nr:Phenoxybenzoate dioxygenase subunit alpha [Streptomyces xanthophaeus]
MTLRAEENRRLTEVGPGTPMGVLLGHYWMPVAVAQGWEPGQVRPVELLGRRFALFRKPDGSWSMLDERCPHRGTSLAYGMVEERGIRCPYHGWLFDTAGKCLDMPNEDPALGFQDRVSQPAYPVRERGGLVFAYLGPAPAPELPRFDLLEDPDVEIRIRTAVIPCNWLQIVENGLDPVHLEWLHGHFANHQSQQSGGDQLYDVGHHEELGFDTHELGIVKRRLLPGQDTTEEDWTVGQLVLFPLAMYVSGRSFRSLQFRVPLDDTRTWHIWYEVHEGEHARPGAVSVSEAQVFHADGTYNLDTIDGQDVMAWVTQGPITDRTRERLGQADRGITLLRRLLIEQLAAVEKNHRPRWSDLGADVITMPRRTRSRPVLTDLPTS